jgi:hypothetical protein
MINFVQKVNAALKVTTDPPEKGLLGFIRDFGGPEADLNSVISMGQKITELLLAMAGIFALVIFLWGVFDYVLSFGNDEKIKKASQTMLRYFLGLVIIAASYTIINR